MYIPRHVKLSNHLYDAAVMSFDLGIHLDLVSSVVRLAQPLHFDISCDNPLQLLIYTFL